MNRKGNLKIFFPAEFNAMLMNILISDMIHNSPYSILTRLNSSKFRPLLVRPVTFGCRKRTEIS